MKQFLFLLVFFTIVNTYTQQIENDSISEYIRISGDTIVKGSIGLNEVLLLPKRPFYNSDQIRKYIILKRKTLKVYPYLKYEMDQGKLLHIQHEHQVFQHPFCFCIQHQ